MGRILDEVERFLMDDDWPVVRLEHGQPGLMTRFKGDSGDWGCLVWIDEEKQVITFYSAPSERVPDHKRATMAEFITRVNFGLALGNLEMSHESGEVRFKTAADVEALRPIPALFLKNLIYTNVYSLDHLYPGIRAVFHDDATPAEAAAKVALRLQSPEPP